MQEAQAAQQNSGSCSAAATGHCVCRGRAPTAGGRRELRPRQPRRQACEGCYLDKLRVCMHSMRVLFVDATGSAERKDLLAQVAKMTQREAAQPGDVLRAFTCTNFVFPTNSLFGAKPPVRLPPALSMVLGRP